MKIKPIHDESGYLLGYILFLVLLITSILFGMLFLLYSNVIILSKEIKREKVRLKTYEIAVEAFANIDNKSAEPEGANVSQYGLFKTISSKQKLNNDSSAVLFFVGEKQKPFMSSALTITQPKLHASVTGSTTINGALSISGEITRGEIHAVKSAGKDYLHGVLNRLNTVSGKLFNETVLTNIFDDEFITEGTEDQPAVIGANDFSNELLNRSRSGNIYINDDLAVNKEIHLNNLNNLKIHVNGKLQINSNIKTLSGISFFSTEGITIAENLVLKNTMLVSPKDITIEENNQFENIQIYSKENIKITNSQFMFPSTIGVYVDIKDSTSFDNKIELIGSIVNGSIILINSGVGVESNESKIKIDSLSKVQGLVYSENYSEIYGEIIGSVYTYKLLFYVGEQMFVNWLIDLKINRENLSQWFSLPVGFDEGKPDYQLIDEKWIY
ncbi:MAG: hypothetical protein V1773_17025 [bacterium]